MGERLYQQAQREGQGVYLKEKIESVCFGERITPELDTEQKMPSTCQLPGNEAAAPCVRRHSSQSNLEILYNQQKSLNIQMEKC